MTGWLVMVKGGRGLCPTYLSDARALAGSTLPDTVPSRPFMYGDINLR